MDKFLETFNDEAKLRQAHYEDGMMTEAEALAHIIQAAAELINKLYARRQELSDSLE